MNNNQLKDDFYYDNLPPQKIINLLSLEEVARIDTIPNIKDLNNKLFRLLYHTDYYDGPLSGLMLWNGEKCLFDCYNWHLQVRQLIPCQESLNYYKSYCESHFIDGEPWKFNEEDWYNYEEYFLYKVYRVSKEYLNIELVKHEDFRKYVGIHCDYNEKTGKRPVGNCRPQSEWNKFYDKYKDFKMPETTKELVGEFKI